MTVRREKPYICVDTDLADHDRLICCDDPAGCLGLWVALTAYSRQYLTDGKVPKKYAVSKWGDAKNAERLSQMCVSGLLVDCGTHYEIQRYAPRNQTKAMVEDARVKARVRMAGVRANNRRTTGELRENFGRTSPELRAKFAEQHMVVPTSISPLTVSEIQRDPESSTEPSSAVERADRESETRVRLVAPADEPVETGIRHRGTSNENHDGCFGDAVRVYQDALSRGLGRPVTRLLFGERGKFLAILETHGPAIPERVEWCRQLGAEFAMSGETTWSVHRLDDWLGRGRQTAKEAAARRDAAVEPAEAVEARRRTLANAQARRDAEDAEYRRQAVPAPVGELLAAIGIKKVR